MTVIAAATGQAALRCRSVAVVFGKSEVLHRIDFDLSEGEWLGIIGPNGAGKSTLLRAIAGLTHYEGTVALHGGRVPSATDVALVPQSPILPAGMTVTEYVMLGRTAHLGWLSRESRSDRSLVGLVLRRLDLASFAERLVSELSGGEAQRVVLARALAQQAPILLLDEPTSALDLGHQMAVLELVDQLRQQDGLSVIAAMHDLTTAGRFADRLVLVEQGTVVDCGTPAEVLRQDQLSEVFRTPLQVRVLDGEIVVLPSPRRI